MPLAAIPEHVRRAFVAAEDKRFFEHRGVDERGVVRAFVGNLMQPGRPQGGSTITQQVAKNLLVGDDVTYERKMREMVIASRIERSLSKPEILAIYLNAIYLGRGSWGVEMAAQSYFGKSAKDLTLAEATTLAALTKGPNYYDPDRFPDRLRERRAYVLNRMREDGAIGADAMNAALATTPALVAFERPKRSVGFAFVDQVARDAKTLAAIDLNTGGAYTIRSTILPPLQQATEAALQEGLARYELSGGRHRFAGPAANLAAEIKALGPDEKAVGDPAWRRALAAARLPDYDVQWPAAIVLQTGRERKGGSETKVGLADGRILTLTAWDAGIRRNLKVADVVRVKVAERAQGDARAELRGRPQVQGAALVLENRTGRILAMAGGFSYPLSQLNRATQAHRQPGSALKPLTYLAALSHGLQPNTLVWDLPVSLPPIGSNRERDVWRPKNYDGGSSGPVTLRRALENSKNLVTARLLDGGIAGDPEESLSRVCELALEAQLYVECVRRYPFVLGAQPVRLVDLAAFYAAVANEGALPTPHAIETIAENGRTVYERKAAPLVRLGSADPAAFFQLKSILQGVVERGTASSLRGYAGSLAGKTGTTDGENDAWFVGFTNDVTIAVWVGYDNAGKRRTLGRGRTGAKVAIPIFEPILLAAFAHHAPRAPLNPPSPQAARQLMALPIDLRTGDRVTDGDGRGFTEYFRLDRFGQLDETQYRLVSRDEVYAFRHPYPEASDGEALGGGWADSDSVYGALRGYRFNPFEASPRAEAPYQRPSVQPWWAEPAPRRPRRIDPDYFFGGGSVY